MGKDTCTWCATFVPREEGFHASCETAADIAQRAVTIAKKADLPESMAPSIAGILWDERVREMNDDL